MFGQNTFGSAPTSTPAFGASTGGFGAGGGGGGSLFNNQAKPGGLFGQQQTTSSAGGLFGTQTTSNTFGQAGNNTFGQAFGARTTASTGTGFGASGGLFSTGGGNQTSLFGGGNQQQQQQQQQQQNSSFSFGGGTTGATNTFGAAPTNFGSTFGGSVVAAQEGTGHTKFVATTSTDTMMKAGQSQQISTRHQCITCMKEYENKSMEELRCEDYIAGRKTGGAGGAMAGGSMFGQAAPATGGAGGLFGQQQTTSSSGGLFGQQQNTTSLFGTSGFGANTTTSATTNFGGFGGGGGTFSGAGGFGQNKPTAFGQPQVSAAPAFGATTGGFGTNTSQPAAGGLFGASQPSAFGSSFGQNTLTTNQPQQPQNNQIGLFGNTANTQKPAFGTATTQPFGQTATTGTGLFGATQKPAFGFGQPTSTAPPAFGSSTGFGAATSQPGMFGSTTAKPAFGGFGAATTSQPSTSFGGFGQGSGGGMFGASQNKPAFGFGSTATTAPTQSFGFSNTGGSSLFNNQPKPGGLFGSSTTTGFGATTTGGFGGFGAGTSFGGGGGLTGGLNTSLQQPQAPQPSQSSIHQQLLSLANSPFGENPLFKPLAGDSNKRADILKPTNPAAQAALSSSLYKPSPHRNVKIRVKPNSSSDKSQIFDGLDDDLLTGETFVPRPSVKKLVLRSTPAGETSNLSLAGLENSPSREIIDNSLTVGLQENVPLPAQPEQTENINDSIPADDSFAALNTRKRTPPEEPEKESSPVVGGASKTRAGNCGVQLSRSGYYTIPSVSQLSLDTEGQCLVTGFTVGREGYGNIHFPATMNIASMDMDEIVHIRHKEVIVYPDDNKKPALGEGLNRPAQITLDKVWPVCKSTGDIINSPDRLRAMNYEEKLERASSRLGAKFIEYRPETGSWVFKVEHFSKYGLIDDDSDDEPEIVSAEITQKMKTLEKRPETTMMSLATPQVPLEVLDNNSRNIVLSALDNSTSQVNTSTNNEEGDGSDRDVDMTETRVEKPPVSAARTALFGDEADAGPVTKPVILQHRVSSIANISLQPLQPRVIECVANTASLTRGLGGMSVLGTSNLSSSLMETTASTTRPTEPSSANVSLSGSRARTGKIASYSLQGGYEKWVSLPSGSKKPSDQFTVFIPQHLDTELKLSNSYLGCERSDRSLPLADLGLTMAKRTRPGWGQGWSLVSAGEAGGVLGSVSVTRLGQTSCGEMDPAQVRSLEEWFRVALATSTRTGGGSRFSPVANIDTLTSHQAVAAQQLDGLSEASLEWAAWTEMVHQTWSLMGALWGRVEHLTGEEVMETHDISMTRRQALTRWLETVVGDQARKDMEAAALGRNKVGGVLAELSQGDVSSACSALQEAGDHRTALLAAQVGGGGDTGRIMTHQLERWTEVRADENISQDRLRLVSLIAGCPVWASSQGPVNTCSSLDWPRSLAAQLWYLTHPLASIPDALHQFELSWRGTGPHGPYCTGPAPQYSEATVLGSQPPTLDLRYLLLRLYCDRSTGLEELCDPASHTRDRLDCRLGWFVLRVLEVLGYKHISQSARERIHRDMASQAEKAGLWVWAVFVLQHIETEDRRVEAVKAVIDRNIQQCDDQAEQSLLTDLGVPLEWIAASRATLARSRHNHHDHVENLILAKRWPEAHDVLVKEIAPDCIISQDYQYIRRLLSQLAEPEISVQIPGWGAQGSVYHQYLSVEGAVSAALEAADDTSLQYQLEKLRPAVSRLCRAVSTIPANTNKERLAQSEIAKKVAHLMRAVHSSQGNVNNNSARQMAELLSSLPLPEDYALQELRSLTRSYMMEIA